MTREKHNLSLYREEKYLIKVPGHVNEGWADWIDGLKAEADNDKDGLPVTTITASFDQAALHGFFRYLYSQGLPIISVICVDTDRR